MTVVKKIISAAAMITVMAFLAVTVWLFADRFILGSRFPSFMGYSAFLVETGSMSGEIEQGELIIIKRTKDYRPDDVITYIKDGDEIPTTHRIITIGEGGGFITRGDANSGDDSLEVFEDEILGEVGLT